MGVAGVEGAAGDRQAAVQSGEGEAVGEDREEHGEDGGGEAVGDEQRQHHPCAHCLHRKGFRSHECK